MCIKLISAVIISRNYINKYLFVDVKFLEGSLTYG